MARSAATAAKETSVNDAAALEDTSKHVIDAVQAESTKSNISSSSVDAVISDENFPTEFKGPDPVQHCTLQPGEPTPHQPQVGNVPLQPDGPPGAQLGDTDPPCSSRPACPCFDVNESLSQEQMRAPLSEVPRLIVLRIMRQASGLPPECACDG